jgi:hypothetical protein
MNRCSLAITWGLLCASPSSCGTVDSLYPHNLAETNLGYGLGRNWLWVVPPSFNFLHQATYFYLMSDMLSMFHFLYFASVFYFIFHCSHLILLGHFIISVYYAH